MIITKQSPDTWHIVSPIDDTRGVTVTIYIHTRIVSACGGRAQKVVQTLPSNSMLPACGGMLSSSENRRFSPRHALYSVGKKSLNSGLRNWDTLFSRTTCKYTKGFISTVYCNTCDPCDHKHMLYFYPVNRKRLSFWLWEFTKKNEYTLL